MAHPNASSYPSPRSPKAGKQLAARPALTPAHDPWPVATLLPLLAADETTWREWLALCAAPCLDAAERLAARVNAAMAAGTAAEARHP